jgi:hypothetical protein
MIDFSRLNPSTFELLSGTLLAAESFKIVQRVGQPGQRDRGVDWIFETPDGIRWAVQAKLSRVRRASPSVLTSFATDLARALPFAQADKGLLIVSFEVPGQVKASLSSETSVLIWDAGDLARLLDRHPTIKARYAAWIVSQKDIEELIQGVAKPQARSPDGTFGAKPSSSIGSKSPLNDLCVGNA